MPGGARSVAGAQGHPHAGGWSRHPRRTRLETAGQNGTGRRPTLSFKPTILQARLGKTLSPSNRHSGSPSRAQSPL